MDEELNLEGGVGEDITPPLLKRQSELATFHLQKDAEKERLRVSYEKALSELRDISLELEGVREEIITEVLERELQPKFIEFDLLNEDEYKVNIYGPSDAQVEIDKIHVAVGPNPIPLAFLLNHLDKGLPF